MDNSWLLIIVGVALGAVGLVAMLVAERYGGWRERRQDAQLGAALLVLSVGLLVLASIERLFTTP